MDRRKPPGRLLLKPYLTWPFWASWMKPNSLPLRPQTGAIYHRLRQSTAAPRSCTSLPKNNQATTQLRNPQSRPPVKSPNLTLLLPQQHHMSPQGCLHTRKELQELYILHQVRSISHQRIASYIHHMTSQKKEKLQTQSMRHQKQKNPSNYMTFQGSQNTKILNPKKLNKPTQHQNSLQATCLPQFFTHLQKVRKITNQIDNLVWAMSHQKVCILHQQKQPHSVSIQPLHIQLTTKVNLMILLLFTISNIMAMHRC